VNTSQGLKLLKHKFFFSSNSGLSPLFSDFTLSPLQVASTIIQKLLWPHPYLSRG